MKIPLPKLIPHAENSLVVSGGNRKHNIRASLKAFVAMWILLCLWMSVCCSQSVLFRESYLSMLFPNCLLRIGKNLIKHTDFLFGVVQADMKSLK